MMVFFIRLEEEKDGQRKYNTRKKTPIMASYNEHESNINNTTTKKKKKKTKVKERTSMQQRER